MRTKEEWAGGAGQVKARKKRERADNECVCVLPFTRNGGGGAGGVIVIVHDFSRRLDVYYREYRAGDRINVRLSAALSPAIVVGIVRWKCVSF